MLATVIKNIEQEYGSAIRHIHQDIIVSHIEVLRLEEV